MLLSFCKPIMQHLPQRTYFHIRLREGPSKKTGHRLGSTYYSTDLPSRLIEVRSRREKPYTDTRSLKKAQETDKKRVWGSWFTDGEATKELQYLLESVSVRIWVLFQSNVETRSEYCAGGTIRSYTVNTVLQPLTMLEYYREFPLKHERFCWSSIGARILILKIANPQ